mgnify:CR=1 FL=1
MPKPKGELLLGGGRSDDALPLSRVCNTIYSRLGCIGVINSLFFFLHSTGKGGKNRRRGKGDGEESKRELEFKEDGASSEFFFPYIISLVFADRSLTQHSNSHYTHPSNR